MPTKKYLKIKEWRDLLQGSIIRYCNCNEEWMLLEARTDTSRYAYNIQFNEFAIIYFHKNECIQIT